VKIHDNTIVPALGQGSARLGQGRHPEAAEEEALRTGLSLGMTLIDTAEIYGNGNAERLISHVIAGQRDRVFLVSKVWPSHVAGNGIERACDASLARLGTGAKRASGLAGVAVGLVPVFPVADHRPVSRWCQPQNQTELFTARKRLQKSDYLGSIIGRCESSIRLHVVARHHFIRACDEAI